ncbi:SMC family ATPase [Rathayibacter sp. VKM Ac-2759]|uniref:AAA family ATPase n=1 Tax=Rathayibacter sp. VKM Ac-2759 TaxID=2609252 RepID=UPI001FC9A342|nr:SMC family ATPase [Rathayibacter sp. VKM Ac-2759]
MPESLAAALREDEPCPVCGSTEHPAPAGHGDTAPIGAEDLDRARLEVERAASAMDAARADENAAALAWAALDERAGREGADELESARADARGRLETARGAAGRCETLRRERTAVRARAEELTALIDSAREQRDRRVSEATVAEESLRNLRERVDAHRDGAAGIADLVEGLRRERRLAEALLEAEELASSRAEAREAAEAHLAEVLDERGFPTPDAAEAAALSSGERARAEAVVAEHERRRSAVDSVLAEPELHELPTAPVDVSAAEEQARLASARRDDARRELSLLEDRASRLEEIARRAESRLAALEGRLRRYDELRALAETIDGHGQNSRRMDLEAFALAGRLEEIVAAANLRLDAMTSGRYTLAHDDSLAYRGAASGLGIDVLDAFTGARRQPASLSGGETFLASLALALGLADVVTMQSGGISLETMFIDEGFGSLDAETLETALGTLDALRSGGRTIGLISHVDAMRERLPTGLRVVVTDRGDSTILTA